MEGAVIRKKKKIIMSVKGDSRCVERRRRRPSMKVRRIKLMIGFVVSVLALIILLLLLNEMTPFLTSEKIIEGSSGRSFSLPELIDRILQNVKLIFSR